MQLLTLAADVDASSVLPAVSTLGSLGFAVWYAWYTTTVSLPKMQDGHRQERTEMQTRFDTALHDMLAELREMRLAKTKAIIKTVKDDGSDG